MRGFHSTSRAAVPHPDRKSTRLNSSHLVISYAVFCLKKKTTLKVRSAVYIITRINKFSSRLSINSPPEFRTSFKKDKYATPEEHASERHARLALGFSP